MSQENVEVVRAFYAALAAGELEVLFGLLHPNVELHVSDAYFDAPHTYRGHPGGEQLMQAQAQVFDDFRVLPEEFHDAGDSVVAIVRAGGRGVESGVEVMSQFEHLWSVQSGKIVGFREFKVPAQTLEAAGLRFGVIRTTASDEKRLCRFAWKAIPGMTFRLHRPAQVSTLLTSLSEIGGLYA